MAAWKMAKPDPRLFMSTGLVSKKNRNAEDTTEGGLGGYVMPGTPSKDYKRNSFPPVVASPTANRFSKMPPRPEFGQPSTPFSFHKASNSVSFGSTGMGGNIFGNWSNSNSRRRSSFASMDGDDASTSPCGDHMMDGQLSADDMPPTPTKNGDSAGRRKKDSLRRSTLRQRTSLATDTFIDPTIPDTTDANALERAVTPLGSSPHTPSEPSFLALDHSNLSISSHRRGSLSFNNSLNSNFSFPPATPTTPRDSANFFPIGQAAIIPFAGVTQNDVDASMSERFDLVTFLGNGEFSKVYRAESSGPRMSPASSRVWAVKKTKKPYAGPADRERKMQEVRILQALRGHDHVLGLADSWEHHEHLYIQTEFCEEGDLKNFLYHAGFKGRIDDFRIWKILMELSSVSIEMTTP
jgi:mitosis inhibitor protein kinase SWE1